MDVSQLRYADLVDAQSSPDPRPQAAEGLKGRFILAPEFSEIRLFSLLKWRFGGPNGILTFLGPRGGDPDGPFKWDFLFTPVEPLRLQVIRKVAGIEVWWWGADTRREDVIAYLKKNLSEHSDAIDKTIASLEEYTLLLNPYVRYRSIVDSCIEELRKPSPAAPAIPADIQVDKAFYAQLGEEFSQYMKAVDRQAVFAILSVSASAFMAEAYLNLLLAVLLRKEIRASRRLLKDTLHRPWRTKLERLPADCQFIDHAPDLDDPRVREVSKLFELRNQLAHSYPDPKRFKVGTMWFQESFPVLPTAVPFHEYALALNNQLPSVEEALECGEAVIGFVEYLQTLVSETIARELQLLSNANPLGYNRSKKIYGVPFASWVIVAGGVG